MEMHISVVIVTGGGSGLGAATARMVVDGGGMVIIADVDENAGKQLAAELGRNARFITTDVTSESSASAAIALAVNAFGRLNGLVNCAGVAPAERVLGKDGPHKLETFARVVNVNLIGTFNMIRLAAHAMSRNEPVSEERGVIVNTASIAAFDGQIGQAAYASSKGAVTSMTLPAARDLARHGIRVMTIAPGIMETPMLLRMPNEVQAGLRKSVPFPSRMGRPAEFAALVRHVFENGYLNGEVIRLDGAIRMAPK